MNSEATGSLLLNALQLLLLLAGAWVYIQQRKADAVKAQAIADAEIKQKAAVAESKDDEARTEGLHVIYRMLEKNHEERKGLQDKLLELQREIITIQGELAIANLSLGNARKLLEENEGKMMRMDGDLAYLRHQVKQQNDANDTLIAERDALRKLVEQRDAELAEAMATIKRLEDAQAQSVEATPV